MEGPVGLAYLCCRLLDTIEDSSIDSPIKAALLLKAVALFKGQIPHQDFEQALDEIGPLGSGEDIKLLHEFKPLSEAVHTLPAPLQAPLLKCIEEMGVGMADMADSPRFTGETELFRYCHIVAGTVGELLTSYYCHFQKPDATTRTLLRSKSEAFSQALQRVNIAADAGRDKAEKREFIPGLFSKNSSSSLVHHEFCVASIAFLKEGLEYTLLVEGNHPYRSFCALPLLLACRTLSLIAGDNRVLSPEGGPKVPREETLEWIVFCREKSQSNPALKQAFAQALEGLEPSC